MYEDLQTDELKKSEEEDDSETFSYSYPSYSRFTFTGKTKSRLGRNYNKLTRPTVISRGDNKSKERNNANSISTDVRFNSHPLRTTFQDPKTPNVHWLQSDTLSSSCSSMTPGTSLFQQSKSQYDNQSSVNDSGIDVSSQSNFLSSLKSDSIPNSNCKRNLAFNNTPFKQKNNCENPLKDLNHIFQKPSCPKLSFYSETKAENKENLTIEKKCHNNNKKETISFDPSWNQLKEICDAGISRIPLTTHTSDVNEILNVGSKNCYGRTMNEPFRSSIFAPFSFFDRTKEQKKDDEDSANTPLPLDLSSGENLNKSISTRSITGHQISETLESPETLKTDPCAQTLDQGKSTTDNIDVNDIAVQDHFSDALNGFLPKFLIPTNKAKSVEPVADGNSFEWPAVTKNSTYGFNGHMVSNIPCALQSTKINPQFLPNSNESIDFSELPISSINITEKEVQQPSNLKLSLKEDINSKEPLPPSHLPKDSIITSPPSESSNLQTYIKVDNNVQTSIKHSQQMNTDQIKQSQNSMDTSSSFLSKPVVTNKENMGHLNIGLNQCQSLIVQTSVRGSEQEINLNSQTKISNKSVESQSNFQKPTFTDIQVSNVADSFGEKPSHNIEVPKISGHFFNTNSSSKIGERECGDQKGVGAFPINDNNVFSQLQSDIKQSENLIVALHKSHQQNPDNYKFQKNEAYPNRFFPEQRHRAPQNLMTLEKNIGLSENDLKQMNVQLKSSSQQIQLVNTEIAASNQELPEIIQQKTYLAPSNPCDNKILSGSLPQIKSEIQQVINRPNISLMKKPENDFKIPTSRGLPSRANTELYVNNKTYTILSMLGRGGSSEVYQVLDPRNSKLLAVKCVDLSMVDRAIADGYLNEIDLLSRLQGCSSVIRMFDYEYAQECKMLYVVMEKGDTDLSHLIRDICKTKKISMSMIIYYWTEMLNAVKDIHDQGIIHSDLKPANFLLVSGRLKLIDFGIASSQGDMTSVVKEVTTGTWNYMSPEAIRNTSNSGKGFKITYKSDVWSLGCILYNLVYGKTPFSHITNTWGKLQAIADPNHSIVFPEVGAPVVLAQALKSCFHRDPKQRPTVAELLSLQYHATCDTNYIGQQLLTILPHDWWLKISHLFPEIKASEEDKKTDDTMG